MNKQVLAVLALNAASLTAMAGNPGSTTLGGKLYADLTNLNQTMNGQDTNAGGYGIDVKRFYLVVDDGFDDTWSTNLTTDFNYSANDSETQIFVKKAYLQARLSDAATFRAGSADMPWIPFVEKVYAYRYVEQTMTDRLHFGNSADWGLHVGGKLGNSFHYDAALVNGGGYKNPSRSRGMDFAARTNFEPGNGLILAAGLYSGHRGEDTQTAPAIHTASRYNLLAAIVRPGFRLGAEYFRAQDWNNVMTATTDSAHGYSLFGSVALTSDSSLFARYDNAALSDTQDPSSRDTYYNAGVSFALRDNIDLAIAYKQENRSHSQNDLKTKEVGLWMQVKF